MSQKKPRRPRFVPRVILTSTAFAGLAVIPAVSLDCGGKTSGFSVALVLGAVAAVFDAGSDAPSPDGDVSIGSVAASFEGGFFVAASFDAASGAVDAASDSGREPDAPEFVVAANIAPREGDDGSGHG